MNLFWCCALAAFLTITKAAVDVEKTVQQVQSILKANSLLPRLTREEIIELLNDIRAEDSKRGPVSKEVTTTRTKQNLIAQPSTTAVYRNEQDNEIYSTKQSVEIKNYDMNKPTSIPTTTVESTTRPGATFTVVLPYTPRDGSSLQELYTKPPRVQIVSENVTPKSIKNPKANVKLQDSSKMNTKVNKQKFDFPSELQAFLDAHGLEGKPGQDNFLLPLEGFKPLPPAKIVDGTVQLPENLLLTYDLISPSDLSTSGTRDQKFAQTNFLYDPLRPEIPFELDTSSSESKHTVLPLDLPKPRKTKAVSDTPLSLPLSLPNYEPIDYDAVKVIPLNKGPNPVEDEVILDTDQNKRQANETEKSNADTNATTEAPNTESKGASTPAPDVVAADSDTGASITDLEDSFGGAAPVEPGDSVLPPPRKNGFYWMLDWNSFLEVGDGDTKVNIRFEPKLGDKQMFLPVNVP